MRTKVPTAEHQVALIAARQHGVMTLQQLLAGGLSRDAVKYRVAKGVLNRELQGVYRVGHCAPSVEARYMAAVLACGPAGPPPRARGAPAATSSAATRTATVTEYRPLVEAELCDLLPQLVAPA